MLFYVELICMHWLKKNVLLCQAWDCTTGSGTGCATCVAQSSRTSATTCASCNSGYELAGATCQADAARHNCFWESQALTVE